MTWSCLAKGFPVVVVLGCGVRMFSVQTAAGLLVMSASLGLGLNLTKPPKLWFAKSDHTQKPLAEISARGRSLYSESLTAEMNKPGIR